MAYSKQTWTDNVTVVDKSHMDHIEDGLVLVDGNASTALIGKPSYGTTLPVSPVDGQEAVLVDSTTNPSYQWRFRYNAGSSSAYKWEYMGGSPTYTSVVAVEFRSVGGFGDLATVGPRLQAPRAGQYDLYASMNIVKGTPVVAYTGLAHFFAETSTNITSDTNISGVGNVNGNTTTKAVCSGKGFVLAANEFVKISYAASVTSADLTFGYRELWLWPVRVA